MNYRYKHTSELHSCRHCEKIVVTQRQIRTGLIELPQTRLEAVRAAKDRCPVFMELRTETLMSLKHHDRFRASLTKLKQQLSHNLQKTLPFVGRAMLLQPFSFIIDGNGGVRCQDEADPSYRYYRRYKLKAIGGMYLVPLINPKDVGLIWVDEESAESIVQDHDVLHGFIDKAVDSSRDIAEVRRKLRDCLSSHTMCHIPAVGFAPSRLLEVSPDLSQTHIRLFETDRSRQPKWACLSYVWGTEQLHKTTKGCLLQYMKGICIADLPQTIQDAVTVCRTFDIPNLWVDSLCIVQDDVSDKTRELPLMAEIYRHSLLTISAACARSVTDGFLRTDLPFCYESVAPTALRYLGSDGSKTKALVLVESPHRYLAHDFTDPIDTRAWTLQERLLSPRLLTYSSHGVIWSCRRLYSRDDQEELYGQNDLGFVVPGRRTASIPCIPGSRMQPWHNIVEQYSHQDMSLPSDKLVALSAVAQTYSQNADEYGTYLSGLWKEMMPRSLMWYVPKGSARCRPNDYRAPSWSWASVDSLVVSGGPSDVKTGWIREADAKVMVAETTPAVEGFPFGAVIGGTLVLDAQSRCCYVRKVGEVIDQLQVVDGPRLWVWIDTDDAWESMSTGGTEVILVFMGYDWLEGRPTLELNATGLILVEAGDDSWRRVAVFECESTSDWTYFSGFKRNRITIV